MRKNYRALLLKESCPFQAYLSNIHSTRNIRVSSEPYTLLEFSKGKENSYDSKPVSIMDFKKYSQNKKPNYFLYKNFLELSDISKKLPNINESKTINNNNSKNRIANSVNEFLYSSINSKINNNNNYNSKINNNNSNPKNNNTIFNKNIVNNNKRNLLLNSIEVNKNDYPRYIFLSKIFKLKKAKLKKNFINRNILQSNSKSKPKQNDYKIKNTIDYKNYINKRAKLSYNTNFESSFVHKIKSEYMILRMKKKYPIKSDKELDNIYKDEDEDIIELEGKDVVEESILNNNKIFGKIKNVLFNQNLKYKLGKETKEFFETKENKINFLYDICLLPNFKNNLIAKNENGYIFLPKLETENYIDCITWRYLNKAKFRLQKIKDDPNFFEIEIEEEDELSKGHKNLVSIDNNNINDELYKEKYECFEIEDYICKKKESQSVVTIMNEKSKKLFYGTFLKLHNKK